MERGLRRGSRETALALAEILQLDDNDVLGLWRYVGDHVPAAILDSDLTDDAKLALLEHYDRLRELSLSSEAPRP